MFAVEERQVYEYPGPDGASRFADPMATNRKLAAATGGRLEDLVRAHNRQDAPAVQSDATEKLYAAACQAFGLKPFDQAKNEGVLEGYALQLLEDFREWCDVKKNSTDPTPSGLTPTDSSPAPSPTSATSPCGC